MNNHLYLKRIEFYSMANDTCTMFHQAIFVVGTSQIISKAMLYVTHLGHRCVITALINLGPGSMPRVGSSGQNLEHNLKICVSIYMEFIIMQVFRPYS